MAVIVGTNGSETLNGTIDADTLSGLGGDDILNGLAGDDLLDGGLGADQMHGGDGADTYFVDNAGDTISDSSGIDLVEVATLTSYTLAPGLENLRFKAPGGTPSFLGIGSSAANQITGWDGADILVGAGGADILRGGKGNDTLIVGAASSLLGEDGDDVLWFFGASVIDGGAGFDHAIQLDAVGQTRTIGGVGIEVYVANNGNDVIYNTDSSFDVPSSASTIIYGGGGADFLKQGSGGGYLFGQDGNDALFGGSGADIIIGGDGWDQLNGEDGNDVLYFDTVDLGAINGGAGIDYAIVNTSAPVNVTLYNQSSIEVFIGNSGSDVVYANTGDAVALYGGDGNDFLFGYVGFGSQLFGQNGNDVIYGGTGTSTGPFARGGDVILGGAGDDIMFGDSGNDTILGEEGNDKIVGGPGLDAMWGGSGDDTFRFERLDTLETGPEVIADFGDSVGDNDVLEFFGIARSQLTLSDSPFGLVIGVSWAGIIVAVGIPPMPLRNDYTLIVSGATVASIQDDLLFT